MFRSILVVLCLLPFSFAIAQSPESTATATEAEKQLDKGTVARAQFTSAVQDREPVDNISKADTATKKVWFFTELTNMQGESVTHRWVYNNENMAEKSFDIGGNRWRVYTSKNLVPEWTGEWTVEVVASDGRVLDTQKFNYEKAAAPDSSQQPSGESASASETSETEPAEEAVSATESANAASATESVDAEAAAASSSDKK